MRLLLLSTMWLTAACGTCPQGTVKEAGQCIPDPSAGTADDPVTEDNFQRKFNIRRCQAAEACLVDEGWDPDYWDVECDEPWEWDDSCPFDLASAEACLEANWSCDSGLGFIFVEPAPQCDYVYLCDYGGTD